MAKKLNSVVAGDLGALVVSVEEKTFLVADDRIEVTLIGQANPTYKASAMKGYQHLQNSFGEDFKKIPTEELEKFTMNLLTTKAIKGIYSLVSEKDAVELGLNLRKEYLSTPNKATPEGYGFISGVIVEGVLYENTPEDLKELLGKLMTVKDEIAAKVNEVSNFQVGKLASLD